MLSWRTTLLLSLLPIGLVVVLALSDHSSSAPARPNLPSAAEIARAQDFFSKTEAVCFRMRRERRAIPKAQRPAQIRPTVLRILAVDRRTIARLRALRPPPKVAPRFRAALAVLRARHTEFTSILRRFDARVVATRSRSALARDLRALAKRGHRIRMRLKKLAPPLGMTECGK